jgi:dTDP-4-dehydrorhamnose reductase
MTRVLVIGASGMLGHRLVRGLSSDFEVIGTVRDDAARYAGMPHFAKARLIGGIEASVVDSLLRVLDDLRPDVVINAVGAIKQVAAGKSAALAITLNALLPHQLAEATCAAGGRFITFGTDCVFSGRPGPHAETDIPDAIDIYGRTKLLGEVGGEGCLTLRTSIVGRELRGCHSLIEWFISQNGKTIKGFRRALYSGMTTGAIAALICRLIRDHAQLSGIWQVAGPATNKFELLTIVRDAMGLDIEIVPGDDFFCDRRLDGSRFTAATGIVIPSWSEMIADMAAEASLYAHLGPR